MHDVKLGITYVSEFAYLADGKNGMRSGPVDLAGHAGQPGFQSAADAAVDRNIHDAAWRPCLERGAGLDRDRAVDESGNQIGVFGRIGARPLSFEEQRRLFLRPGETEVWRVSDNPTDPWFWKGYKVPTK